MEQRVLKVLESVDGAILTYGGFDMLGDGVIDSFQVIDIVAGLEDAFSMEIDARYVVAENFANKDSVIALMRELISGQPLSKNDSQH